MQEFEIGSREAGQRLDKYLFRILDQAPKGFVYKMLRKKNIVLNGKKATGQEPLHCGDRIRIYVSDGTFARFASKTKTVKQGKKTGARPERPEIVYEDTDILIINKPAGILSQKAASDDYSANEMILDYLLESGQVTPQELRTFHPSVCNRLDRNTSGLLIAGKTMRGLQQMSEWLRSRAVQKYYRCLVWGDIREDAHLSGYLVKDHRTNQVRICLPDEEGASLIETAYHPVCRYQKITLLEVHLITGRSHQIRAHLASIGHPILGDAKYGNHAANRKLRANTGVSGQLLHAYRMEFPDGRVVTAKEPAIFAKVIRVMKV